jgi:CDP-glucose 4,6-dehydratase
MKIDKEFWKDKRVFITGGTGFVGTHLTDKLVSLGAIVKLFTHFIEPEDKNLIGFRGDLTYAYEHLRKYLVSFQPDIVFHLAAQPIVGLAMKNVMDTTEINIRGTYHLLYACKDIISIKSFVHVSTDKVFGSVEEIQDNSPLLGFEHPYNATKLCGDIMAQMYSSAYNLPVTVIRNGNVYGPWDFHWDRLIPGTIKKLFGNDKITCRGGSRDYIYINDLITGYLKLVEVRYGKPELETITLGAESSTETMTVISTICKLMNKEQVEVKLEPMWKGELINQHIIGERAKELIDWCPDIPLDAGLQATVRWYEAYLRRMNNG